MLRKLLAISSALLILMLLSSKTLAEENTVYWDGGGKDNRWMEPLNWSNNKVPQSQDHVILDGRCTKNIEINEKDKITIKSLTIKEGYTGTVTANSPEEFRIQGKVLIESGTILWKQIAKEKRIIFEEDVKIKGGFVELIGAYKVARNFTWEGGILSAKEAVFDIYLSYSRHFDIGSNSLILKAINIYHGVSPELLQFKGNITICHDFKIDANAIVQVTEHSILDLSRINKSSINMDKLKADPGSKIIIMENNKMNLRDLKDIYYSAEKNLLRLEGNIDFDSANKIVLKYTIDNGEENIFLEFTDDEEIKNFRSDIVLPQKLEEGKHTIIIWGEDDRGYCFNVGSMDFYIDNTPPSGSIRTSLKEDTNEEVLIYLTAKDTGGSGLSKITLPNGVDKTISGTVYEMVYTAKENGIYQFTISDRADNSSEIYAVVETIGTIGNEVEEIEEIREDEETEEEMKDEEIEDSIDDDEELAEERDDEGIEENIDKEETGDERIEEINEEEIQNEEIKDEEADDEELQDEETEDEETEDEKIDHEEINNEEIEDADIKDEDVEDIEIEYEEEEKEEIEDEEIENKELETEEIEDEETDDREIKEEKSEIQEIENVEIEDEKIEEKIENEEINQGKIIDKEISEDTLRTDDMYKNKTSVKNSLKQNKDTSSRPKEEIKNFKMRIDILRRLLNIFQRIFTLRIGDFRYGLNG
ncbi:MAG: hypothetical protein GX272_09505 [Epulopiscium sp.]|nr:hypothetical protein [Candidatus Epulonipiscium sp.]